MKPLFTSEKNDHAGLPGSVESGLEDFAVAIAERVKPTSSRHGPSDASSPVVVTVPLDIPNSRLRTGVHELALTLGTPLQPAILVSTCHSFHPGLADALQDVGLHIHFTGTVARQAECHHAVAVVLPHTTPSPREVPVGFRVTAVMTVYNEADILAASIRRLCQQGVGIHVIDNWSTDGSFEIARDFLGQDVIGLERYPKSGPTGTYDWEDLLSRVEEVAAELESDWIIHHDVDEYRMSPWEDVSIRTGLHFVQSHGFNAVDHTVVTHHPTSDSFVPGQDFVVAFPYFEFGTRPGHFQQVKAWSAPGERVDLANSGGHQAVFEGRRVFPFNFLLRHYPIRSQGQGEKKVFNERKARWNPSERSRGWHTHYDSIGPGHEFVRSPESLLKYEDSRFHDDYLLERLLRIGLTRWS